MPRWIYIRRIWEPTTISCTTSTKRCRTRVDGTLTAAGHRVVVKDGEPNAGFKLREGVTFTTAPFTADDGVFHRPARSATSNMPTMRAWTTSSRWTTTVEVYDRAEPVYPDN